jgi:hypothetical protein
LGFQSNEKEVVMGNRPQQKKADKSKYADRAYLDYEEACDYLGVKRATLYKYMTTLNIQGEKFELERKHFLAMEDIKLIERVIAEPWLVKKLKKQPLADPPEENVA